MTQIASTSLDSSIKEETQILHPLAELSHNSKWQLKKRKIKATTLYICCLAAMLVSVSILGLLLAKIFISGMGWLNWQFLENVPSRFAEKAGIKPALWGTIWLLGLTSIISIPLGVGAAVYIEEIMRPSRLKNFIELNIANLTSVPSIIFGILGLAIFVRYMNFGKSLLSGALTLSILVLPIIMIATREALQAVPVSLRQAALAVGATRWQTTRDQILPQALPNILTGIILSISRAIGETAPLIMVGALSFIAFTPEGPMDEFTALPMQIFNWASRPQLTFHELSAAAIIVLLILLLGANAVAIVVRNHYQRKNLCNRL